MSDQHSIRLRDIAEALDYEIVGDGAIIFAKAGVSHNIKPKTKVSGMFAREHSQELKARAKLRKLLREE